MLPLRENVLLSKRFYNSELYASDVGIKTWRNHGKTGRNLVKKSIGLFCPDQSFNPNKILSKHVNDQIRHFWLYSSNWPLNKVLRYISYYNGIDKIKERLNIRMRIAVWIVIKFNHP